MPDEPSNGELARRFEDRLADIREDIQQLGVRLNDKVNKETYDLRHEALSARVTALEALREKDAERLVATRRWLIGAVIVPLIGVLLPVILMLTRGAAG